MRCVNVNLLVALLLCLVWVPQAVATDYVPVKRSEIPMRKGSFPARPAPRPQPKQLATPKKVPIPSFTPASESARQPEADSKPPASNGAVKLFGTVEFKRPLDAPGWLDVLERNRQNNVFLPGKQLINRTKWEELRGRIAGLRTLDMLRQVNEFWNRNPYREDRENWGREDYWEIPAQFVAKSGDCEDYAIAKYFTLRELGIEPQAMRIVVLRDTIRNLAHAVLAVYVDGDAYILDNLSNVVLSHKRIRNYSPQFSVNELGRWTHIKGKK